MLTVESPRAVVSERLDSAGAAASGGRRLESIDALRGFDMFWIIGGDHLVRSLPRVWDCAATRWLAGQMEHCEWAGFHFYDMIFPLFVFIVGVVIPFSLPGIIVRAGRGAAVRRVVVRGVVLFLLGVFYMGGVSNGFGHVYLAGVLHRIGVAYLFAGSLFCLCRVRTLAAWTIVLLAGYWALMTFVPVPGVGAASYQQGQNLAHWVDQRWLPGQKFEGTILSTMAAVANCLLGVFAGVLLKDATTGEREKVGWLVGAGVASLLAGIAWSWQFPIVKLLWTSTYVLVACGLGALLLGMFHLIIEVWGWRRWCRPLIWIGANAITIYLVSSIANFRKLADRIVGGEMAGWLGNWATTVNAVVALGMAIGVVWFLYRKRVFIRL